VDKSVESSDPLTVNRDVLLDDFSDLNGERRRFGHRGCVRATMRGEGRRDDQKGSYCTAIVRDRHTYLFPRVVGCCDKVSGCPKATSIRVAHWFYFLFRGAEWDSPRAIRYVGGFAGTTACPT